MTKLVICGQAPSRIGDGRPFSGPSGKRLVALFNLRDYEHLASQVTLVNLFGSPQDRARAILCGPRAHAGDDFDQDRAMVEAFGLILRWLKQDERIVVLACGNKVFRAFTDWRRPMFKGVRMAPNIDIWHFPHPSGASHYWNSPDNRVEAAKFIKRLLKRYGIVMAR